MAEAHMNDTQVSPRTPLVGQDRKLDIIEHVNNDHLDEMLAVARAGGASDARQARLDDVFEEGCLLVVTGADGTARPLFVPFVLNGDVEENIHYLAYDAMVRQGKAMAGSRKQYFTVMGSRCASPNMLRLTLKSSVPLPENAPGHAWFFSLKTLKQLPSRLPAVQQHMSAPERWFNRLLLWWLKRISAQRREKVMMSFYREQRYYTLRRAGRSSAQAPFVDQAEVDIYLHQGPDGALTPGSQRASRLKAGDIILSNAEYHEKTGHLHEGAVVLVGDETALPTVAAILENWRNPVPPVVFSITTHEADQAYLPDAMLPAGARLHRISASTDAAAAVVAELEKLPHIDAAWGALENRDARIIRQHLRNAHGLKGSQNHIKGYWRRAVDAAGREQG